MMKKKMLVPFMQFVLKELITTNRPTNVNVQSNFLLIQDLNVFPVIYLSIGMIKLKNANNAQTESTLTLPQKNALLVLKTMSSTSLQNFVKYVLKKLQSKTMEFVKLVQSEVTMILKRKFALNVLKALSMILKI